MFERGNGHLAIGLRSRGARRRRELEAAIDSYLGVLRLGARTRNVVFNLGLASGELDRDNDAFNYFSEYLRAFDLSADERAEGDRRITALRTSVAVLAITTSPEGAEIRIDRRDLPARGTSPLEIAVDPGEHRVLFTLRGYADTEAPAVAVTGETVAVAQELSPNPVRVQFLAPSQGTLSLDGEEITAGRTIDVAVGSHVVRLEAPRTAPVERRFEVPAGSAPMTIELSAGSPTTADVVVHSDRPASFYVDGILIGEGESASFPALPGPHRVSVSSSGFVTASEELTISANESHTLHASLARTPDNTALFALRGVTGIGAALGLVSSGIFGALAYATWDEFTSGLGPPQVTSYERLHELADSFDAWMLAFDVTLSITAALGATAIILLIVEPDNAESTITIGAAPSPGGGALTFGATL